MAEVLAYALRYRAAGLSVLPIKGDGTKAPDLPSWTHYQNHIACEEEVRNWYTDATLGVGVVCGAVSGNLAILDFEFADFYGDWMDLVESARPGLLGLLPHVLTPGKQDGSRGMHVYFRTEGNPLAGGKLAWITPEEAKTRTGDEKHITAIELKGENGQVLAPGCPARCHPSGRLYEQSGELNIEQTPVITDEDASALLESARVLTRHFPDKGAFKHTSHGEKNHKGVRPGEHYNDAADWSDILRDAGWQVERQSRGVTYWRRPGKDKGISATTGHCYSDRGGDLLYVFSTNAEPFEVNRAYSKFAAMALLRHSGDFRAAARELGRSGFGEQVESCSLEHIGELLSSGNKDDSEGSTSPAEEPPLPFPLEVLPDSLAEYVRSIGKALDCPADYAGVSLLVIAGAAIGNTRALAVTRKWLESPRIFAALVGDPGGGKSPALELVSEPLIEVQNTLKKEFEKELADYEMALDEWEHARKRYAKGDASIEVGCKPERPIERHLYTNDPTMEALMPMLSENPRGFIVLRDEIAAWATSMNQYKGGKGSDRQAWLQLWSGQTNKSDRKSNHKTSGSLIAYKPFISIIGGIQPDMLSELSDEQGREDGFVHRILFCFPQEFPWSERIGEAPPEHLEIAWNQVMVEILGWDMEKHENGPDKPYLMQFSEQGRMVADQWYAAHARERNAPDFTLALNGPWSKLRSYYFRFCLLLHCLRLAARETECVEVDGQSAKRAWTLMDYFKGHLRRVYLRLHSRSEDVQAEKIITWIVKNGGEVTPRDVMRARLARKATQAEKLLRDLVDRGLGEYGEIKTEAGHSVHKFIAKAVRDEISE